MTNRPISYYGRLPSTSPTRHLFPGLEDIATQLERAIGATYKGAIAAIAQRWEELGPTMTQAEAKQVVVDVLTAWPTLTAATYSHLMDRLFTTGFMIGIIDSGVTLGPNQADTIALQWLRQKPEGFIRSLNKISDDGRSWIEDVITDAYAGIDKDYKQRAFDLDQMVKRVVEHGDVGKNRAELIVRTECLADDTSIFDPLVGRSFTIQEIVDRELPVNVISYNESTETLQVLSVEGWIDKGEKECFEIVCEGSRSLRASAKHLVFTPTGWKHVQDLKVGDRLAAPLDASNVVWDSSVVWRDWEAAFTGYFVAEGVRRKGAPTLAMTEEELIEDIRTWLVDAGVTLEVAAQPNCLAVVDPLVSRKGVQGTRTHRITSWLRDHDLYFKYAWEKVLPSEVFRLPLRQQAIVLSRLYAGDGYVSIDTKRNTCLVGYSTTSKDLAEQVSHLLARFGIPNRIDKVTIKDKAKWNAHKNARVGWKVLVNERSHLKKLLLAGLLFGRKERSLREWLEDSSFVKKRTKSKIGEGALRFPKIKSITAIGPRRVYDLSVPHNHNFVAEGLVAHNTTNVTNNGRLAAWEQDPLRDWYWYDFIPTHDDRTKDVSLFFEARNPYTFPAIKRVWTIEHFQPVRVRNRHTGRIENQISVFNCRCTSARRPKPPEVLLGEGKITQAQYEAEIST